MRKRTKRKGKRGDTLLLLAITLIFALSLLLLATEDAPLTGWVTFDLDGEDSVPYYSTAGSPSFSTSVASQFNACGVINVSGSYEMTGHISSVATCLTINASHVDLDCKGYSIVFGTNQLANAEGINVNATPQLTNVSISNCNVTKLHLGGDASGIIFRNTTNSWVINSTIQMNGTGDDNGINIRDSTVTVINSTLLFRGSGGSDHAIEVDTSHDTLIQNNSFFVTGGGGSDMGIRSDSNTLNLTIVGNYFNMSSGGASDDAIAFVSSHGCNITQNTFFMSGGGASDKAIDMSFQVENCSISSNVITFFAGGGADDAISPGGTAAGLHMLYNNISMISTGGAEYAIDDGGAASNISFNRITCVGCRAGIDDARQVHGNYINVTNGNGIDTDDNANITNNTLVVIGVGSDEAIDAASDSFIFGNVINMTIGASSDEAIQAGNSGSTIFSNRINVFGNGAANTDGIDADEDGINISYNIIRTFGPDIPAINIHGGTTGYTVFGNTIYSNASVGINIDRITHSTFIGNTINLTTFSMPVINFSQTNTNLTFNATTILGGLLLSLSGDSLNISLTNTTFSSNTLSLQMAPRLLIPNGTQVDETAIRLNASQAFVNSTAFPFLNVSGLLTFQNISFTNPISRVDFEDDGTFTDCTTCTTLSFSNNIFIYNVSHFTSYTTSEGPACDSFITSSTNLTQDLTCPATALHIATDNVTLDCKGFSIVYGTAGASTMYGINVTSNQPIQNITIKNCNLSMSTSTGKVTHSIQTNGVTNLTIRNTTAAAQGIGSQAFRIIDTNQTTLRHNTLRTKGANADGIVLASLSSGAIRDFLIANNTVTVEGTGSDAIVVNTTLLSANFSKNWLNSSQTFTEGLNFDASMIVGNIDQNIITGAGGGLIFDADMFLINVTRNSIVTAYIFRDNVFNSTVEHNRNEVGGDGVGFSIFDNADTINVTNNSFTGDFNLGDSVTNSHFVNNSLSEGAISGSINHSSIAFNSFSSSGDASLDVSGEVFDVIFRGNSFSGGGNPGIDFNDNVNNTLFDSNDITSTGSTGITFDNAVFNTTFSANTIVADSEGILFSGLVSNVTLESNRIHSADDDGVEFELGKNISARHNSISTGDAVEAALDLGVINSTFFFNTTLSSSFLWVGTTAPGTTNVTFQDLTINSSNTAVRFLEFFEYASFGFISNTFLTLGQNSVKLDNSNVSFLNVSAELTLRNIGFTDPKPRVDIEDDGTFIDCEDNETKDPRCTELNFTNGIFTFNVTHFTSYASAEAAVAAAAPSGGGGGGRATRRTKAVEQPRTEVARGNVTAPKTRVVDIPPYTPGGPVACVRVEDKKRIYEGAEIPKPIVVTPAEYTKSLPAGYSLAVDPVILDCDGESVDFSFAVPQNYLDVQTIVCRQGNCAFHGTEYNERLECGDLIEENVRLQPLLTPELLPLKVEQAVGSGAVESKGYQVTLVGRSDEVELSMPYDAIPQPQNPALKILGTPIMVTTSSGPATVKLPLFSSSDTISPTLAVLVDNTWEILDSSIVDDSLEAEVTLDAVTTIAVLAQLCENCGQTNFENIYSPLDGSRNAVILVHGLGVSPARFNDIVNDIRFTKQPFQAWLYGYPSTQSAKDSAIALADYLEENQDQFDNVYFAAHSLGGRVVQHALRHAADTPGYTFLPKIKKVVLIATPNKELSSIEPVKNLFNFLINQPLAGAITNLESTALDDVLNPTHIEQVDGVDYYVIAGTKTYEFNVPFLETELTETNDGILGITNAQSVGSILVNNQCENYWEIAQTHTELLDNHASKTTIERILSQEVGRTGDQVGVLGYNNYYNVRIDSCEPGDQIVIIGKYIEPLAAPDPTGCACGNGICGIDEDEVSCPSDCLVIEEEAVQCPTWPSLAILVLAIVLLIGVLLGFKLNIQYWSYIAGFSFIIVGFALAFYRTLSCGFVSYLDYALVALIVGLCVYVRRQYYKGMQAQVDNLLGEIDENLHVSDLRRARQLYIQAKNLYLQLPSNEQAQLYPKLMHDHEILESKRKMLQSRIDRIRNKIRQLKGNQ